jgi:hypothetical protein
MERGLCIGAVITAASGVAAYSLLSITHMANSPTNTVATLWFTLTAVVIACNVLWTTILLAVRKEDRPIAKLKAMVDKRQAITVALGTLLFATNLAFFCTIKPQLGQLVAFSADPLLADIDRFIFGADPWRLLEWFNHDKLSIIYHRGWFLWLAFVLYYLLKLPPTADKDRLIVSYIVLWSIFGPLVHLAFPAAGPVFYDDLGLGSRFSELDQSPRSIAVANYLWGGYVTKTFNPAGGISAMPSLHLATMFWSIIAVRKTRWFWFSIAFTTYIFVGSIVIGWHYAIDGIVGAAGAFFCYGIVGVALRERESREGTIAAIPEAALAVEGAQTGKMA